MKFKFLLLFVLFFSLSFSTKSQIIFDKTNYDFDELFASSERFVDFKLTNSGKKKEYLLSVRKPNEVTYLVNGQYLDPDSSLIIRLKPNSKKLGKFNYEVEVYTSDKLTPTILKIKGNIKEFEENSLSAMQACPDFGSKPSVYSTNFKITVVTIDKETKEVLSNSTVSMIQNGMPIGNWKTNKNGQIVEKIPLGYTYFYSTHIGYLPTEQGNYVNFQRNYIVLELSKDPKVDLPIQVEFQNPTKPIEPTIVEKPIEKIESQVVVLEEVPLTIETLVAQEPTTQVPEIVSVEFNQIPFENFDSKYFKPINVVFVLDKSSSMLQGDKLELMKYSLFQLTNYLRPEDKMSIVTYSSTAKVLVPPTAGNEKDFIKKPIEKIRPGGGTAGGDGIKLGFEQAVIGYMKDGANLVVVITDGAFNKNSDDYQKSIEKHKNLGINLSVVGIKNLLQDEAKMKEAAKIGNGRYVPIFKLADAQKNLIQEIRISAFRK
jgi:Ca-activated chloride channel family protein